MVDFQNDIKVATTTTTSQGQRSERLTLALSPSGDIATVEGREKLAEQLMRALANEGLTNILNTQISTRRLNTLVNLILRNFRQAQIVETEKINSILTGFAIHRFGIITDRREFVRVSPDPVTYKFIETGLNNGIEYTYGISQIYGGITESAIVEKLLVTPSQFTQNQEPVIGTIFTAVPGDGQVTFYVDYNRYFRKSELLEEIDNILIDTEPIEQGVVEPRKWIINITVKDLNGNKLGLQSEKYIMSI
jgi:hypothetical protein